MTLEVPFFKQDTDHTCGPACLQMVLAFFGRRRGERELAEELSSSHEVGTRHGPLIEAARREGLYCYVNNDSSLDELKHFLSLGLPAIVHFTEPAGEEDHYAVLVGFEDGHVVLNDPWNGPAFRMREADFLTRWHGSREGSGYERWAMVLSDEDLRLGKQYGPTKAA